MSDAEAIATALKAAMRRMTATVALVTTRDPTSGLLARLAASAVIPVSMEPPAMLVSINRQGSAHAAIQRAGRYCINLLGERQSALTTLFSDCARRDQRFAGKGWADADGLANLPDACAAIVCRMETTLVHCTQELFVGRVQAVLGTVDNAPLEWLEGEFARLRRLN